MRLTMFAVCIVCAGANAPVVGQSGPPERTVVKVVERLFDAMRGSDSAKARSTFHPAAQLIGTYTRDGAPQVRINSIDAFIEALGTPHDQVWDERIWDVEVRMDGGLATVWTPYAFYLGDTFSHCGVDAFQLARGQDGWKIVSLADTRSHDGCWEPPRDR